MRYYSDPYRMDRDRTPRPSFGVAWVDPRRTDTPLTHPYSYSEVYLWRDHDLKGSDAVYSDRMAQWDHEKSRAAFGQIGKNCRHWTREDAKRCLETYFGGTITPTAMAEGCNVSNGYPYWIFWFKRDPSFSEQTQQQ